MIKRIKRWLIWKRWNRDYKRKIAHEKWEQYLVNNCEYTGKINKNMGG